MQSLIPTNMHFYMSCLFRIEFGVLGMPSAEAQSRVAGGTVGPVGASHIVSSYSNQTDTYSVQALRVLDNAMDTIIEKPDNPKSGWSILERCLHPCCHLKHPMLLMPWQLPEWTVLY